VQCDFLYVLKSISFQAFDVFNPTDFKDFSQNIVQYVYCFSLLHCVVVSFTVRPILSHGSSCKSLNNRSISGFEY